MTRLNRHFTAHAEVAPFRCEVEPHRHAAHVVAIGELDIATAPLVHERLAELRDAGFRRLVLDLGQVSFLDLHGLHLMLAWTDSSRGSGATEFAVIVGGPAVQRVFHLTGTAASIAFVDAAGTPTWPRDDHDPSRHRSTDLSGDRVALSERFVRRRASGARVGRTHAKP